MASMKRIVTVPVTWERANRRKARTVGLAFESTLEVSNEDFAVMDTFAGKSTGWLMYAENELTEEDVPEEDAPTDGGKTKIQRLKAVYFLIWKQRNIHEPFQGWWDRQFEIMLDKRKQEIE